jgi:hypothetical protein
VLQQLRGRKIALAIPSCLLKSRGRAGWGSTKVFKQRSENFQGGHKMDTKKNNSIFHNKIFYGAASLLIISLLVALFRLLTHGFLNAALH